MSEVAEVVEDVTDATAPLGVRAELAAQARDAENAALEARDRAENIAFRTRELRRALVDRLGVSAEVAAAVITTVDDDERVRVTIDGYTFTTLQQHEYPRLHVLRRCSICEKPLWITVDSLAELYDVITKRHVHPRGCANAADPAPAPTAPYRSPYQKALDTINAMSELPIANDDHLFTLKLEQAKLLAQLAIQHYAVEDSARD